MRAWGGVIKASSWEDAVANCNTFIIAVVKFTPTGSTYQRAFNLYVPKEYIGSNIYVTSGFYHSSTNNAMAQLYIGTDGTQGSSAVYYNGASIAKTVEFYYD